MERMENIGILTSGGDCPGMNTAVRAAVFAARVQGIKMFGIQRGYAGLYEGDWEELTLKKVDAIHAQGGTILRTARFMPFLNEDYLGELLLKVYNVNSVPPATRDSSALKHN